MSRVRGYNHSRQYQSLQDAILELLVCNEKLLALIYHSTLWFPKPMKVFFRPRMWTKIKIIDFAKWIRHRFFSLLLKGLSCSPLSLPTHETIILLEASAFMVQIGTALKSGSGRHRPSCEVMFRNIRLFYGQQGILQYIRRINRLWKQKHDKLRSLTVSSIARKTF